MKYLCTVCFKEHWGYCAALLCCPDVDKHGDTPIYAEGDQDAEHETASS